MKAKLELPLEIELQLLEMGISLVELMRDVERLIESDPDCENFAPTFSSAFVH